MGVVASHLNIISRTLRRQLLDEGTGFQTIKDAIRRDRALYHLSQKQLSIAQISQQLGFSELGAFTRSFKDWTGVSRKDAMLGKGGCCLA